MDATKITENEIREILKERIKENGLRKTSRELGFSHTYLNDITSFGKPISKDVAERLGFERVEIKEVYFIKKKTANDAETEKK